MEHCGQRRQSVATGEGKEEMKIEVLAVMAMIASQAIAGNQDFRPGELWPDNNGSHINAHGGGILFHAGTYYWFGEHKIEGKAGNVAHVGVHAYASRDLLNWTDEGIALKVEDDPESEISRGCILERPKVVFNKRTGKFVMWFHLEHKGAAPTPYSTARSAVAVADKVTGPYRFLHSLRATPTIWPLNFPDELKNRFDRLDAYFYGPAPFQEKAELHLQGAAVNTCFYDGQMSRDQTVFVDDDGMAYHIAASEHNGTLQIRELDPTYTTYTGKYIRIFPGRYHEAPAVFKRNGKYFMVTSGCTGWAPNAARSAVADAMMGEWKELGNPCAGTNPQNGFGSEKTFGGQSTFVLPLHGTPDAFIAMFDIWRPDNAIDGRYVWLPVEFNDQGFSIPWKTEWDLTVFD
jgi:hypothetical protein